MHFASISDCHHFRHTCFTGPKFEVSCIYLSSYGATGPSRTAHHQGLIGPFGHMTLLPHAKQCSEACYANCTQKVGQAPINQLWINLQ